MQILLIDLDPGKPATATVAVNLVRYLLRTGIITLVSSIRDAIRGKWTFAFIRLIWLAFSPIILVLPR